MRQRIGLQFGVMANPFDRQLRKQGYKLPPDRIPHFEKVSEAASLLCIGGYISERVRDAVRRKLLVKILTVMKPIKHRAPRSPAPGAEG